MISYKLKIMAIAICLCAISCAEDTSKKKAEYEELFHQVLNVHDEVMPRIGDIPQLKSELKKIADTSSNSKIYREAEDQLVESDSLMMDWMHRFSDEFVRTRPSVKKMNNQELEQQIKALQTELQEVRVMQDEIMESLTNARKLTQ